jgi:integrase
VPGPVVAARPLSATSEAQGYDVKTVSSRLGHSSVAITLDLYAHAVDGRDKAAGEAMESLIKSATQVQQISGKGPKSAA